jgi:hypothetical protein
VIGSEGTIYFGSNDNNLYAIYPNGTEKWHFTTANIVVYSPAIGRDGTIYISSFDNYLYAIGSIESSKEPIQERKISWWIIIFWSITVISMLMGYFLNYARTKK